MNPPGLSIIASGQKWRPSHQDTWHLTQQVHNYTHTIQAVGGYWSAQFTIRGGRNTADDWLQDGLGRHIEVYDDTLSTAWEGFVNKVTVNYGSLSVVHGPLMDVANRVLVLYSAIEYDEDDNPVVGNRTATVHADDDDSIDLYGMGVKVLSTGGVHADEAADIRDRYIDGHAMPDTSKQFRSGGSTDTGVTVDCLGYVNFFDRWAHNDDTGGEVTATAKLTGIIAGNPNIASIPFDTAHIDTNALTLSNYENDYNTAWSVIKDTVARGGTSYERWLFSVYSDLEVYYEAAPTTAEYQQRLSQPRPRIESVEGDEIYPWKVRPGKWIMFPDFLIGQAAELDLKDDPRAMFIEGVKFTAPWGLDLKGGTVDTVNALVAQLGLSGIGA